MQFDHANDGGHCATTVRPALELLQALIDFVSTTGNSSMVPNELREWVPWYLAHHCPRCGVCDDIESLPPEQDGLCIYCWKDVYEAQKQQGVTSTA